MAQNKGANVRYRTIDKCLSAKHGRYSWEDLQRACEDALYRAFSERISVSRRQIFNDLNFMESEAGFRALIKRTKEGKRTYYTYEDPNFSIAIAYPSTLSLTTNSLRSFSRSVVNSKSSNHRTCAI